jgi:hypothetical protein
VPAVLDAAFTASTAAISGISAIVALITTPEIHKPCRAMLRDLMMNVLVAEAWPGSVKFVVSCVCNRM